MHPLSASILKYLENMGNAFIQSFLKIMEFSEPIVFIFKLLNNIIIDCQVF